MKTLAIALCSLALFACGGEDEPRGTTAPTSTGPARYALQSVVLGPESQTSYVSILRSTGPQTIDYEKALELSGWGDLWVHEGYVYVSSGDAPTITRYEVGADDALIPRGTLSFGAYGLQSAAFWANTFIAPDKAYMINDVAEYVVWNPLTMTITGEIPLPALEVRPGLRARAGTTDRSNVIRGGKLYQPMYWGDDEYVRFSPDSRIFVIDIATDKLEQVIEVPCAGLDVGTLDHAGNLWFSTWTSGVLEPLAGAKPPNCVAQIAAGANVATAKLRYRDVAEGREGAAARAIGPGQLVLSIFHNERVDLASAVEPVELLGTENWRLWGYDVASGKAAPLEGAPDNSGAVYTYFVDGAPFLLIPGREYEKSTVYALKDGRATAQFETRGWATRLFRVP